MVRGGFGRSQGVLTVAAAIQTTVIPAKAGMTEKEMEAVRPLSHTALQVAKYAVTASTTPNTMTSRAMRPVRVMRKRLSLAGAGTRLRDAERRRLVQATRRD